MIGGTTPGAGGLVHIGRVGSGFSEYELLDLGLQSPVPNST